MVLGIITLALVAAFFDLAAASNSANHRGAEWS
jgi:hypothetical protein